MQSATRWRFLAGYRGLTRNAYALDLRQAVATLPASARRAAHRLMSGSLVWTETPEQREFIAQLLG